MPIHPKQVWCEKMEREILLMKFYIREIKKCSKDNLFLLPH